MTNTIEYNRMHETMYSIVWAVMFSEIIFFNWVILIQIDNLFYNCVLKISESFSKNINYL